MLDQRLNKIHASRDERLRDFVKDVQFIETRAVLTMLVGVGWTHSDEVNETLIKFG